MSFNKQNHIRFNGSDPSFMLHCPEGDNMAIDENKQKHWPQHLVKLESNLVKGSIMRLGEDRSMNVETISTGSLSLDVALGAGGLPRGRIVEIYGPESSGKTNLDSPSYCLCSA